MSVVSRYSYRPREQHNLALVRVYHAPDYRSGKYQRDNSVVFRTRRLLSSTSEAVRWTTSQVYYGWIFHISIVQAKTLIYRICQEFIDIDNNIYLLILFEVLAIVFAVLCLHIAKRAQRAGWMAFARKRKPRILQLEHNVRNADFWFTAATTRSGCIYGGDRRTAKRTRSGCIYGFR